MQATQNMADKIPNRDDRGAGNIANSYILQRKY